jgi:uncharacterized protein DUF5130
VAIADGESGQHQEHRDNVEPAHAEPAEPSHGEVAIPEYGALDHAPTWHPEVLNGPLSTRSLLRLEEALRQADVSTGLTFSVYIGELTEPVRADAEAMHAQLAEPERSVLIAVSPNQRVLEIVTGIIARRRILDRDAKLAALSMSAAFAGGDLGGGVVAGIAQLAEHAGPA